MDGRSPLQWSSLVEGIGHSNQMMNQTITQMFPKVALKVTTEVKHEKCCFSLSKSPNLATLVEVLEGCIGPSGRLLCLWQTTKNPSMFDCWADPVVHLFLHKSFMIGLVVMGVDCYSRSCELEFQHRILDSWTFTLICCSIVLTFEKTKDKWKRGRELPILKTDFRFCCCSHSENNLLTLDLRYSLLWLLRQSPNYLSLFMVR